MKSTFPDYYSYKHPLKNAGLFFRRVRWAGQRARRGYSDWDVGEMGAWFSLVVPDMLAGYRKGLDSDPCGFPAVLWQRYYEEHCSELGMSYGEFLAGEAAACETSIYKTANAECRQTWKGIIDEMIFLFREADEDTCSKQNRRKISEPGYANAENELFEYRCMCRKKAFALFGEWLEYLWL